MKPMRGRAIYRCHARRLKHHKWSGTRRIMTAVEELQKKKKTRTRGPTSSDRPQSPGAVKLRFNTKSYFLLFWHFFTRKNLPLFRRKTTSSASCARMSFCASIAAEAWRAVWIITREGASWAGHLKIVRKGWHRSSEVFKQTYTHCNPSHFFIKMCCEGLVGTTTKSAVVVKSVPRYTRQKTVRTKFFC